MREVEEVGASPWRRVADWWLMPRSVHVSPAMGALAVAGWNPITGTWRLIDEFVVPALGDVDGGHTQIVVFSLVGWNVNDSVGIGHNLKYLNYEKAISVSRLQDIPKKVIKLLRS